MEQAALSRREQARRRFEAARELMRCPVCGGEVGMTPDGRLLCGKGHSFDLSRGGYLNLCGGGSLPGYGKELFAARREIFAQGFYDPVADEIAALLARYAPPGPSRLLDAGCGEGFYAARLARALPGDSAVFGVDLSRDAVALATQSGAPVCWCVCDLRRLPVRDGALSAVLNVLTPAAYEEFGRVLAPGGVVIKVFPGEEYLREVRGALAGRLRAGEYSSRPVDEYARGRLTVLGEREVRVSRALTPEQAAAFFRLTPLTQRIPDGGLSAAAGIREITIHLRVLVGTVGK